MNNTFDVYSLYDVFYLNTEKGISFQKHFIDKDEMSEFIDYLKTNGCIANIYVCTTTISKGFIQVM